jgi:DNA-binding MarR family transcriptional regulator
MTRWLTEDEQRSWRAWLSASVLLTDRLSRDLQEQHGLTIADYEILVRLSEIPDRRMRMSELADATLSSRSRLSHQIDRMERAGLVERQLCADDRRGAFAALTDTGWATRVASAPDHVTSVRKHLVDQLSADDFAVLGSACQQVADHLASLDSDGRAGAPAGGRVGL